MQQSTAKAHLAQLLPIIQRIRSQIIEGTLRAGGRTQPDELDMHMLQCMHPLLFSTPGPVELLVRLTQPTRDLQPTEFYNCCWLVRRLQQWLPYDFQFPDPTTIDLVNWDPEPVTETN